MVAVCGIKCTDLTRDATKIKGIFFHIIKILNQNRISKNFNRYWKSLRMWRRRNLTPEGKTIIFKTFALWKFVFLAVLPISNEITATIQWIQREFLRNTSNVKIKDKTICNDFQNGSLKNVDISSKTSCLQSSWVKKTIRSNLPWLEIDSNACY